MLNITFKHSTLIWVLIVHSLYLLGKHLNMSLRVFKTMERASWSLWVLLRTAWVKMNRLRDMNQAWSTMLRRMLNILYWSRERLAVLTVLQNHQAFSWRDNVLIPLMLLLLCDSVIENVLMLLHHLYIRSSKLAWNIHWTDHVIKNTSKSWRKSVQAQLSIAYTKLSWINHWLYTYESTITMIGTLSFTSSRPNNLRQVNLGLWDLTTEIEYMLWRSQNTSWIWFVIGLTMSGNCSSLKRVDSVYSNVLNGNQWSSLSSSLQASQTTCSILKGCLYSSLSCNYLHSSME